ncbi:hypothetical protein [Roseivirga misakiensis]|uniref:hypothetical protein n=1 Tax=Roseivirga misakiensis TaxID=1563681 RepID=UPI00114CD653|nr:hypothetical protein [Roseivirga misakiensis]
MKTHHILSILAFTLFIGSCSRPEPKKDDEEYVPPAPVERVADFESDMPAYKFEFGSLALNINVKDLDHRVFKHFGHFYTEDYNIYRLDRVDYLAESYFIDEVNLYFIDSLLVRIQAFLKEDKTDEFLRKYGSAKISIDDYHNKTLLKTEKVVTKKNGKYTINEKLDAYTLKWIRKDLDISYQVSKKADTGRIMQAQELQAFNDKRQRYKLTFQTKDFENQLAWVKWESYQESKKKQKTR